MSDVTRSVLKRAILAHEGDPAILDDMVLTHHDAHTGNIVWDEDAERVMLIDTDRIGINTRLNDLRILLEWAEDAEDTYAEDDVNTDDLMKHYLDELETVRTKQSTQTRQENSS